MARSKRRGNSSGGYEGRDRTSARTFNGRYIPMKGLRKPCAHAHASQRTQGHKVWLENTLCPTLCPSLTNYFHYFYYYKGHKVIRYKIKKLMNNSREYFRAVITRSLVDFPSSCDLMSPAGCARSIFASKRLGFWRHDTSGTQGRTCVIISCLIRICYKTFTL